jgi:hypothetical protein
VNQRTPAQRPFSLFETYATMSQETRNDPLEGSGDNYVTSTAVNPQLMRRKHALSAVRRRPVAHFIEAPSPSLAAGAPIPANGIIEYGRPSIELASVNEAPTATLTLYGEFPSTQGSLVMSSSQSSPAGATPLSVTSWSPSTITATIPPEGPAAAGYLYVISAGGVPSNPVPLTQWAGTAHVVRSFTLGSAPFNNTGSGTATIAADFTFHFRADVHPVVGIIDTDAQPQNFFFPERRKRCDRYVLDRHRTVDQHQPIAVGDDFERLSTAHGAVSVIEPGQLRHHAQRHRQLSTAAGGLQRRRERTAGRAVQRAVQRLLRRAELRRQQRAPVHRQRDGQRLRGKSAVSGFGIAASVYAINATPFVLDSDYNVTVTPNLPASDGPQQLAEFSSTSSTTETFRSARRSRLRTT